MPRPNLAAQLQDSDATVALVVAPPGYGKTTLVSEMTTAAERPFAWLTVTEEDNDPSALLAYVALALDSVEPLDRRTFSALAMSQADLASIRLPRLGNLLASAQVPIIMVGPDLRIRRMTPVTERILNVAPGDIGRPIGDLRLSVDVPHLEALLREVMETLTVQERDVEARDGRWYSVRVRPYRTADNKIEGAVISFVDIDALQRGFEQAREARDQAQAIIATVREPLVILDADLRVVTANRSFYETFQTSREETEGLSLFDIGHHRWNVPRLRTLLEEASRP